MLTKLIYLLNDTAELILRILFGLWLMWMTHNELIRMGLIE